MAGKASSPGFHETAIGKEIAAIGAGAKAEAKTKSKRARPQGGTPAMDEGRATQPHEGVARNHPIRHGNRQAIGALEKINPCLSG